MAKAYIGLGTNFGDKEKNIARATTILGNLFSITKKSSVYETEPLGSTDKNMYYNSVIEIETEVEPEQLLTKLQNIENQFGRSRMVKYGNTTIDLDLLFYDDKVIEKSNLQIPHMKIKDRMFVLLPMSEIAPEYVHPITKKTIKEMLDVVDTGKIVKKLEIGCE